MAFWVPFGPSLCLLFPLPPLCFILFLLLPIFHCLFWKRRHLPPGPIPLPLLGNLIPIARNPPGYAPFQRWAKQYGPVFTVWFGEDPHVVVTDFELLKKTAGDAFSGRHYSTKLFKCFKATHGLHGIIRTEGEEWRELRRFAIRSMRNLSTNRENGMEAKILTHTAKVVRSIQGQIACGKRDICLEPMLDLMSGSVISELVFGFPLDGERAEEFHELKCLMNSLQAIQGSTRGQLLDSMPWLRHLPPFGHTFRQLDLAMERLYGFFDVHIETKLAQRRETRITNERKGEKEQEENVEREHNLVDLFMDELEKNATTAAAGYFTMDSLRGLCFDIFVAGQETSTNTLNFLFLYLLLDQQSQRRVHDELDQLAGELQTGPDDMKPPQIGMTHRPRLPFLCAVLNETQRLCNLLPINLSHRTLRDAQQLGPYTLPKGIPMLPQIGNVHFDEKIFPDPYKFRPERFIDDQGRLKKCEELLPFGIGKRQCAGEPLARMELFLFAANFLSYFHIAPSDPLNPPSTEKRTLLTVMPRPYKCTVEER